MGRAGFDPRPFRYARSEKSNGDPTKRTRCSYISGLSSGIKFPDHNRISSPASYHEVEFPGANRVIKIARAGPTLLSLSPFSRLKTWIRSPQRFFVVRVIVWPWTPPSSPDSLTLLNYGPFSKQDQFPSSSSPENFSGIPSETISIRLREFHAEVVRFIQGDPCQASNSASLPHVLMKREM